MQNDHYFCKILIKLVHMLTKFSKNSDIKFYKNPSRGYRFLETEKKENIDKHGKANWRIPSVFFFSTRQEGIFNDRRCENVEWINLASCRV